MEQDAKGISTEEKKDVAKEDLGMFLESCAIKNAISLWDMPNGCQMLADYKRYYCHTKILHLQNIKGTVCKNSVLR